MDDVISLYEDGKLLVRAMDLPRLIKQDDELVYDLTTWINEFDLLMGNGLTSASSTLIIPDVGVSTYKNMGFLLNSSFCDCFHITKLDSGSSGNTESGDFHANPPDFETIDELSNYIRVSKDTNMNEVNINASIDSVVGLFINECKIQDKLLQMIYLIKKCLDKLTGLDYPIYIYKRKDGKLESAKLTDEIISSIDSTKVYYWKDELNEPVIEDINIKRRTM